MTKNKIYLILVVIIILGAIFLLEVRKTKPTGDGETVTVVPRTEREPSDLLEIREIGEATESSQVNDLPGEQIKYLSPQEKAKTYELAKEITTPDGFINTDGKPVTIGVYVGKKIVLVDFWTYSCINCQRTTPFLNSWYEKYKDKGFVIVGVHTPEFEFEKKYENVVQAVGKFDIKFPVVLDNDYSTWTAYKNRYWPRKYLIDIDGYIVYDHIGEGAYEETEMKIRELLEEKMFVLGESGEIGGELTQGEEEREGGSQSQETYFGALRNEFLANGMRGVSGMQKLEAPQNIADNLLYLIGTWNIDNEFARNENLGAKIIFRYTAQNVFLVAEGEGMVTVKVLRDGKPLGEEMGEDVVLDSNGNTIVKIKEARLYKIIEDTDRSTYTLEFIIENPGLKAFAFTFG
jgi:thiol-disulfide isomerase/thioredoxin